MKAVVLICCFLFSAWSPSFAVEANCNVQNTGLPLNVTECRNTKGLYVDGKYVKSMCIIDTLDTVEEALQRCEKRGMNLFIIDSAGLQSVFHQSTNDFLSDHPNGHVWINGMRDKISYQWTVYHQNRKPKGLLFNGIDWVTNGQTSGNCLRYAGQNGPYKSMGFSCDSRHWIVCEYDG